MVDLMDQETFDNLFQCNFDPASKNGSSIGISLAKVRPQGVQVWGTKTYPNGSGNPLNWFKSFLADQNYLYDTDKCGKVEKITDENKMQVRPDNEKVFKRRLEAEKYRLNHLKEFYLAHGRWDIAEKLQKELENIEEEHPEWLI